jgi:hypothetical protein
LELAGYTGSHEANGRRSPARWSICGATSRAATEGAAKKAWARACAKAGNPIAILDAKGDLYVGASLKDHQPAQTLLLDKMSEQVTVSGALVKKGAVAMIYVESVR